MNDHQIIELVRKGDGEAYGELVRRYHRKVSGHCSSMLLNYTEAEEAAQDIFVKAYFSLGKFKGKSSFSTWLFRITANHCMDILRKRNRRKNVSLDALVEKEGDSVRKNLATSTLTESKLTESQLENGQLMEKVLSVLDAESRRIILLKESDGLEYQEIAQLLNCSLDAVKGRLARARQQLRDNRPKIYRNLGFGSLEEVDREQFAAHLFSF